MNYKLLHELFYAHMEALKLMYEVIKSVLIVMGLLFILILFLAEFYPQALSVGVNKEYNSNDSTQAIDAIDSAQIFDNGKYIGRNAMIRYIGSKTDSTLTIDLLDVIKIEDELSNKVK